MEKVRSEVGSEEASFFNNGSRPIHERHSRFNQQLPERPYTPPIQRAMSPAPNFAANRPVSPNSATSQSNAVNRSTSFTPSISLQTSAEKRPLLPNSAMVQSNEVSILPSYVPYTSPQASAANRSLPPNFATAQTNIVNGVLSCIPSSVDIIPIPPEPATDHNNTVNRSVSFGPSTNSQTPEANIAIPPSAAVAQSNTVNGFILINSMSSRTSVANTNINKTSPSRKTGDVKKQRLSRPNIVYSSSSSTNPSPPPGKKHSTSPSRKTGDVKKQRLSRPNIVYSSSSSTNASPPPGKKHSSSLYSSVYGVLTCSVCDNWMTQGQIKLCACKIICEHCASSYTKCEDCLYEFKHDIRAIKLHERVADKIDRPCKHKRDGCTYVVKPGDQHETNCEFMPVPCVSGKCNDLVSKSFMQAHFEKFHFLKSTNQNVKLSDFYLEDTGSRKVKCIPRQGHIVYISIFNVESAGESNQFTVVYPVNNLNVSVKLDFEKDGYTYSRSTDSKPPTSTNGQIRMKFIDVDKKKFNDWINGDCKLDIKVTVVKKRQLKAPNRETNAKKTKIVKKKIIKEKRGMDKKVMKSLQAAHKQRQRNEYLKESIKTNSIKKEC